MPTDSSADRYSDDEGYQAGIKDLLAWDGQLAQDSTAALKYVYWREQLVEDHGKEAVAEAAEIITNLSASYGGEDHALELSEGQLAAALQSLSGAMAKLKQDWGSYDAVYGDKFRVGRDESHGQSAAAVGTELVRCGASVTRVKRKTTRAGAVAARHRLRLS